MFRKIFLCLILTVMVFADDPRNQTITEAIDKLHQAQNYVAELQKRGREIAGAPSDECKPEVANLGFVISKLKNHIGEALLLLQESQQALPDLDLKISEFVVTIAQQGQPAAIYQRSNLQSYQSPVGPYPQPYYQESLQVPQQEVY